MIRVDRKAQIAAALLVVGVGGCWLICTACPDPVYFWYSETRRWVAAAGPVQKLPTPDPTPRDEIPCRVTATSGNSFSPDQYFPPGVLGCNERQESFLIESYSKQLKALGEPSLWTLSKSDPHARAYRFLWLRSFHHPVSVRVVVNPDFTGILILKTTSGAGGYEPGTLIRNTSVPIGKYGTSLLLTRELETRFWEMPARGRPGGTDGAQWILEAVTEGKYQLVDRWSPGKADPVYTLGMTFLVDLAGMRIDPQEIY